MSALLSGIHDRSTVVQKAFAFALGHLVRVSTIFHKSSYDKNNSSGSLTTSNHGLFYLVSPSDSKRQQRGEATTEAQHLVFGERG